MDTERTFWIKKVILAGVISLIFAFVVFPGLFTVVDPFTTIRIEDTATKNEYSGGTDVRLRSIKINHKEIPFDELQYDKEWIYLDDLLVAVNPHKSVFIEYTAENVEILEVELQKHDGSGIVKISANNEKLGELDLYSSEWKEIKFIKKISKISILSNPGLFVAIFVVVLLIVNYTFKIILQMKGKRLLKKYLIFTGVLYLMLLIGGLCNKEADVSVLIILLTFTVGIIGIKVNTSIKDRQSLRIVMYHTGYLLLGTAIVLFYMVENISNHTDNMAIGYAMGNISIYFLLLLILYMLFRNVKAAILVGEMFVFLYAVANYYVTVFRGSPIVPGDFFILNTARTVFKNYHYEITWDILALLLVLIIWSVIIFRAAEDSPKVKKENILYLTVPAVLLVSAISGFEFYKPPLDFWNLNNNIERYGIAMSLISNIKRITIREPEGYLYNDIERLADEYSTVSDDSDIESNMPNVIVIMNESFSDLSVLSNQLDSKTYMPYFSSLEDNVHKGKMMVSVIGGGTSNTEYEFLTGNTMAFIPGTVPYQQFVLKDAFSIARNFKQKGYATVAIHPYNKSGYNRTHVYPHLGFDDFLDIQEFKNPVLERDLYVADEESYKKVIEIFEKYQKIGRKAFIFNVTMQNHSGYSTGFYGEDRIKVPGYEGRFQDVEEYLTLIKKSDEAFRTLIDYFHSVESPTVILVFGDHQPNININFYEVLMGKPLSEWSLEEMQRRYEVPFFIWANYDIGKKDGIMTSANYLSGILFQVAGISETPYQRYLLQMQKLIPAINVNGFLDQEGIWHSYAESGEWSHLLNEYWKIQYNNMFAKKKCLKWFSLDTGE